VNELHKVLVLPRGLFASGKFDQYKRDIPYTTLAQAFQTLVRQILAKSKAEVTSGELPWRRQSARTASLSSASSPRSNSSSGNSRRSGPTAAG